MCLRCYLYIIQFTLRYLTNKHIDVHIPLKIILFLALGML